MNICTQHHPLSELLTTRWGPVRMKERMSEQKLPVSLSVSLLHATKHIEIIFLNYSLFGITYCLSMISMKSSLFIIYSLLGYSLQNVLRSKRHRLCSNLVQIQASLCTNDFTSLSLTFNFCKRSINSDLFELYIRQMIMESVWTKYRAQHSAHGSYYYHRHCGGTGDLKK